MNEYDSDKLGDILKHNLRMIETKDFENADLLILNTCSIREKAQDKVYHQLGRWKKIKKQKLCHRPRRRHPPIQSRL